MIDDAIIERLYSRRRFGIKLGLEVVRGMLTELGDPQNEYGIVHVAGTNGKGSVCAILESIFRACGYRTGLYTSPHLVSLNERFKVSMVDIDDASLSSLIDDVEQCAVSVEKSEGRAPTFFECTTVMAFEHFKRTGVDMAVIETGLGGRFDATNVVLPLLSVITRISMEHTEHLGDNLVSIAHEKAGIIKRGRPVICGAMDDDARDEVRRIAEENGAGFRLVEDMVNITVKETGLSGQKVTIESQGGGSGTVRFPLIGAHQVENLAICVAVRDTIEDIGIEIDDAAFMKGIANVSWPGRFQILEQKPPVVLDGAHNPAAAKSLAEALRKAVGFSEVGLVLGMCDDKDVRNFLKPFAKIAKKIWIVPIANERSQTPDEILGLCREMGLDAETSDLEVAMREAKAWALDRESAVCITGSLFLVGEVLENIDEK